jgi:hypothetical protein
MEITDEREVLLTGSKIVSVRIEGKDRQLKGDPNSTTRTFTVPEGDGPWEIHVTLPSGREEKFNFKYREEGRNNITIEGMRQIRITGSKIESVEIDGKRQDLRTSDTAAIVTLRKRQELDDGPWSVSVILEDKTRKDFNYGYRSLEDGEIQTIILMPYADADERQTIAEVDRTHTAPNNQGRRRTP